MTWGLEEVGQGPGLCDHVPGQRCCGAVEAGAGGDLVEAGAGGGWAGAVEVTLLGSL